MIARDSIAPHLKEVLARELPLLAAIHDGEDTRRPNRPGSKGWSQREELGHLIDSAVNNHNRFIRAILDGHYSGPGYDQNEWVKAHGYVDLPWPLLVDIWHAHNAIMVAILSGVPEDRWNAPCVIDGAAPITLHVLADEYILHMQHHLDLILRRDKVTRYPRELQHESPPGK